MQEFKEKLGIGANKRTFGFLALLIAIPVAVGLISVVQGKTSKNPDVLAANQANDLLKKVSELMDVPDETPTIATVSDVSKLSGQEFFAKAQNGDKVLIFPNAQKAILYRPGTNKVIEVAFYTPPDTSPAASQAPANPTPTTAVSLRQLLNNPSTRPSPAVTRAPSPAVSPQVSLNP